MKKKVNMDDLENLPTYRIEKTAFKTYAYDSNNKLIEQWYFFRDIKDGLRDYVNGRWMRLKCKIAFALLKNVVDCCPHCKKLILLSPWSNPFNLEKN